MITITGSPGFRTLAAIAASLLIAATGPATAGDTALPPPTGAVLLRVEGAIERHNDGATAAFDDAMLASLPQFTFTTTTIWTNDRQITFTGPSLAAVLDAVGATGTQISAAAVNDYIVTFDRADLSDDAPIVARLIDGKPFSLRDKGPLWVVYPYDADPAYRTEVVYARSIWQLAKLTIQDE